MSRAADVTDWSQVRLVAALRWTLLLRDARTRPVAFSIRMLVTLLFVGGAGAAEAAIGVSIARLADAGHVDLAQTAVLLAYTLSFVALAVGPLLAFGRSDLLDVTKLFSLPVSERTLFVATLVSAAVSVTTFVLVGALVAVTLGLGGPLHVVIANVGACLLLALFGVSAGRTGTLALHATLKSRRWRDVTFVLVPLVSGLVYLGVRVLVGDLTPSAETVRELLARVAERRAWLLPVPSSWAAQFVGGSGPAAWMSLAALGVGTWIVLRIGTALHARLYAGDGEGTARSAIRVSSGWVDRLGGTLGALLGKDLRLLRREPVVRVLLVQMLAYAGIPLVFVLAQALSDGEAPDGWPDGVLSAAPLATYMLLAFELGFLLNMFGLEGRGAAHTLGTSVGRRKIVLSKALVHAGVFGVLNATLVGVGVLVLHELAGFGLGRSLVGGGFAGLEAVAATAAATGAGVAWSVLRPVPLVGRRRGSPEAARMGREGCLGVFWQLGGLAVLLSTAAPVLLAFRIPEWFAESGERSGWRVATALLAVAWAVSILGLGVATAAEFLERREERVLARLLRADSR